MTIYTGGGDKGVTGLLSGERVAKDDLWVETYGTLDELGSHLGFSRAILASEPGIDNLAELILNIQKGLFRLGMQVSSCPDYWSELKNPVCVSDIEYLENAIDSLEKKYGLPDFFVTPGDTKGGAALHMARTVCRRAERRLVSAAGGQEEYGVLKKYLNRLSDLLFSLSWASEIRTLIIKEVNNENIDKY